MNNKKEKKQNKYSPELPVFHIDKILFNLNKSHTKMQPLFLSFIFSEIFAVVNNSEIPDINDPQHLIITIVTLLINLTFILIDRAKKKKGGEE